jgi:hypothetical protein
MTRLGDSNGGHKTGHLQSATTRAAPMHSEPDREVSPPKSEENRDLQVAP